MQDIHHIGAGGGGGGGRYFGGGDRRLRPHSHQALKCPRCDSLNTKFCYYNNYNLSQPRHFCKSCRRYWTKGGVLRNVPVGGGCRKAKRSKHKSNAVAENDGARDRSSNAQSSSSESSSLTASTTTPTSAAAAAADEGSAPSNPPPPVFNFADARFISNSSFDPTPMMNPSTDGQIFATESFPSMMTSPPDMMAFGVTDIPTTSYGREQQGNEQPVLENNSAALPAAVEEFKMQEMNDGGLAAALHWGNGGEGDCDGGGDQGLFDLTAAVDPAYWSQPQWTDSDNQSLNFLP